MKHTWTSFLPGRKADDAIVPLSVDTSSPAYRTRVYNQFCKNRLAVWSVRLIGVLIFVALFADFLANEKPIACKYKGRVYFPVIREYLVDAGMSAWPQDLLGADWKKLNYDWSVFPLIPYLPQNLDHDNEHSVSPFGTQKVEFGKWKHWLGTDELGRDVFSGLLHGTRIALSVGLVSMGVALFIGLIFGSLAGYYGDNRLQISRARLFLNFFFGLLGFFYGFGSRSFLLHDALSDSFSHFLIQLFFSLLILAACISIGNLLVGLLKKNAFLSKKVTIPVDLIVSRLIEIMLSVPTLFLIISVAAILTKPSIFIVMLIIGLTGWTSIARFVRAELLRIRGLDYIESAKALGFSELRILFRHALPNALTPVLIAFAFGIASSILTESLLSFLGIGVPAESITWGSMLAMARQSPGAWWVALFPGFAIFITVTVYNLIGEGLSDALDPKQKK
jgi:peptide/nickel transport system permease protein